MRIIRISEQFHKNALRSFLLIMVMFTIIMSISSVKAAYSAVLDVQDSWYDGSDPNGWGAAYYSNDTNQYKVKAWSWLYLDGHARIWFDTHNDIDYYFEPTETKDHAHLRIVWYFDGYLSGAGNGFLHFTYTMSNGVTLSNSGIKTYTATTTFTDDLEYHEFTTSYIVEGSHYYIDCEIHLFHDDGDTSDFMTGGNGLELVQINLWTG